MLYNAEYPVSGIIMFLTAVVLGVGIAIMFPTPTKKYVSNNPDVVIYVLKAK